MIVAVRQSLKDKKDGASDFYISKNFKNAVYRVNEVNPLEWDGRKLIFDTDIDSFGNRCLICSTPNNVKAVCKPFSYVPLWGYFLFFTGIGIPLTIFLGTGTKRIDLYLPLCGDCRFRWTMYKLFLVIIGCGGIFIFPILGYIFGQKVDPITGPGYGIFGAIAVYCLCWPFLIKLSFNRTIRCLKIKDSLVTLGFPNFKRTKAALQPDIK